MKNLSITYVIALSIIGLVVLISQYLIQSSISTSLYDSRTINISGRQTMLSQRITKAALAMETAETEAEFVDYRNELKAAAILWENSHQSLQYGNEKMGLEDVNNSDKTLLLFLESESHYEGMRSAIGGLVEIQYADSLAKERVGRYTDKIQKHEGKFLDLMNQITFSYDNESKARVQQLSQTEYVLLAIALLLLILEAFFIFRPVFQRVRKYTQELIDKEKSIQLALDQTRKEKKKVDYLNHQAQTVFSNVRQGIFLMDDQYTISELHSEVLQDILRQDDLAGTNFVKLLRPKLVHKNQEALEDFVELLFDPKIKEKTLQKLNPVENVEIYHSENGEAGIEARHLSISFSRIRGRKRIYSILVNIADESDTVMLQKQIQEAEERNKRESAQLLSILKVDPLLIKQLLTEIKDSIQEILDIYEKGVDEFDDLIEFTFRTIHHLKGNTSLIDLQLLEDKFHQIEEIIIAVKEKDKVVSKDFLKILYEINEVTQITNNMQQMLSKIAQFNMQLSENEETKSMTNEKLKTFLNQGVAKLSRDAGKQINFLFTENDIKLSEEFLLLIKDLTIQLVRNSLAHGIESEQERLLSNKTQHGNISLTIHNTQSDDLMLIYKDDGRGLDLDRIVEKAIAKKIVGTDEVRSFSDAAKANLIFIESFSTSENADMMSGRGQGMSIIKSIVDKSRGTLAIDTVKDRYFSVSITLPVKKEIIQLITA
ncbi:MAG: type IV pili methyl-accepting chemotaxis transducer N-terminal domain-containing protein [Cyclobacteriaceae bacterium]